MPGIFTKRVPAKAPTADEYEAEQNKRLEAEKKLLNTPLPIRKRDKYTPEQLQELNKPKYKFEKGTIPKVEKALKDAEE